MAIFPYETYNKRAIIDIRIFSKEKSMKRIVLSDIDEIIGHYTDYKNNLITILQKTQDKLGYLPDEAISYIALKTGIQEAKIYGVVTFYKQFKTKPSGRNHILICRGTACHVKGTSIIEKAIVENLGIKPGEVTPDGMFSFEGVACLGCCSLAPVMMIGEEVYAKLTAESAVKVLESIKEREKTNED